MATDKGGALTTTSHVLLAQLALRPWSAYELAVQRVRYFRFFWPRASRAIYTELKRLDSDGLVTAARSNTGRRQRTTYTITAEGRRALQRWLGEPVTPITIEFEALVRIFTAPLGTKQQLVATLDAVRADLDFMTDFNDAIIAEYVEGRAPFQDEAYVRTLVVDFVTQFLETTSQWVDRTSAVVDGWSDTSPKGKTLDTLARLEKQRYHPARISDRS